MKAYGIIYLLRNLVNGKCYIGQTTGLFRRRMNDHKNSISKKYNSALKNAITKHGWDNFEKYHIDTCYTNQNDLNTMECHYIDLFNSKVENGFGYNVRDGGSNGHMAEETKIKLSKINTGVRGRSTGPRKKKISIEMFITKLKEIHGETIVLDVSTYKNIGTKARFIHKDYGEWWANPGNIYYLGRGHPVDGLKKSSEKQKGRIKGSPGAETLKKMSIAQSGENHPMWGKRGGLSPNFGKKYSHKRRENISNAMQDKKLVKIGLQ